MTHARWNGDLFHDMLLAKALEEQTRSNEPDTSWYTWGASVPAAREYLIFEDPF